MDSKTRLSRRTQNFIEELLSNPKLSATEAYLRTHQTTNRSTARVEASKILANPNTRIYLEEHVAIAKARVVDIVANGSDSNALRAAQDILDRNIGKPHQTLEVESKTVNVMIDLSGGSSSIAPKSKASENEANT